MNSMLNFKENKRVNLKEIQQYFEKWTFLNTN